ncbi:MAG: hypothetical protein QOK04_1099, partial [Solirubrobacteraceae bacterium]|nr:hypothetical protein [Solirubrobacteraceae bacterium]
IRNVQGYLYGGRTRELALRAQQRFDEHGRPRSQSPGGPVAAA